MEKVITYLNPNDLHYLVGQNLRRIRKRYGINQAKLGEVLGVSYQQIQKYEMGHSRISAASLFHITNIFKIDVDEFIRGAKFEDDIPAPLADIAKQKEKAEELMHILMKISCPKTRSSIENLVKTLANTPVA